MRHLGAPRRPRAGRRRVATIASRTSTTVGTDVPPRANTDLCLAVVPAGPAVVNIRRQVSAPGSLATDRAIGARRLGHPIVLTEALAQSTAFHRRPAPFVGPTAKAASATVLGIGGEVATPFLAAITRRAPAACLTASALANTTDAGSAPTIAGARAATISTPSAVIHVRAVADGFERAARSVENTTLIDGLLGFQLVDQPITVLVHTGAVTDLRGPGIDPVIAVVAVAIVEGESVTVGVRNRRTVDVGCTVLGHAVATKIGRARIDARVPVVTIRALGCSGDAVVIGIHGGAGLIAVNAVVIQPVAAELESAARASVAVITVRARVDAVVVQVVGEAPLVGLTVTILIDPSGKRWWAPRTGIGIARVGATPFERSRIDGRIVVVAVVPTPFVLGMNRQKTIAIDVAGEIAVATLSQLDGAVLINAVATDLFGSRVDRRVVVIAVDAGAVAISILVSAGRIAAKTILIMTIPTLIRGKGIPHLRLRHLAAPWRNL